MSFPSDGARKAYARTANRLPRTRTETGIALLKLFGVVAVAATGSAGHGASGALVMLTCATLAALAGNLPAKQMQSYRINRKLREKGILQRQAQLETELATMLALTHSHEPQPFVGHYSASPDALLDARLNRCNEALQAVEYERDITFDALKDRGRNWRENLVNASASALLLGGTGIAAAATPLLRLIP